MEILIFAAAVIGILATGNKWDAVTRSTSSLLNGTDSPNTSFDWSSIRDYRTSSDDGIGSSIHEDSSTSIADDHQSIFTDPSYYWLEGNIYHFDTTSSISDDFCSIDSSSSSCFSDW